MAVRIWYITNAVSVDKSNMGLTFVPRDISIEVENLNLEYNRIIRITNVSFVQFIPLHNLKLSGNDLTYIENGSFDFNAKLETLSAAGNNIMQLPHSFGATAAGLRNLHLWCALRDPAINIMNFAQMISLDWSLDAAIRMVDLMHHGYRETWKTRVWIMEVLQNFLISHVTHQT